MKSIYLKIVVYECTRFQSIAACRMPNAERSPVWMGKCRERLSKERPKSLATRMPSFSSLRRCSKKKTPSQALLLCIPSTTYHTFRRVGRAYPDREVRAPPKAVIPDAYDQPTQSLVVVPAAVMPTHSLLPIVTQSGEPYTHSSCLPASTLSSSLGCLEINLRAKNVKPFRSVKISHLRTIMEVCGGGRRVDRGQIGNLTRVFVVVE